MKHISEVATSMTFTQETERPQDSTRALQVWVQLAELFGKAFYRENGDAPPSLWVQAVSRLTDGQIAKGLANLGNDGLKFPPNLSIFIEACKRPDQIRPWLALPGPPPNNDVERDKAMDDMRKLVGDERWKEMDYE